MELNVVDVLNKRFSEILLAAGFIGFLLGGAMNANDIPGHETVIMAAYAFFIVGGIAEFICYVTDRGPYAKGGNYANIMDELKDSLEAIKLCDEAEKTGNVDLYRKGIDYHIINCEKRAPGGDTSAVNNLAMAYYHLGYCLESDEYFAKAYRKFELYSRMAPDDHYLWNNWGHVLTAHYKLTRDESIKKQAIQKFTQMESICKQNCLQGHPYYFMDEKPSDFQSLIVQWGDALLYLGKLQGDEMTLRESIKRYQLGIGIKSRDREAWVGLGRAYLALSEMWGIHDDPYVKREKSDKSDRKELLELAAECFERAEVLMPGDWSEYLGEVYMRLNRPDDAITTLRDCLDRNPYRMSHKKALEIDPQFRKLREHPEFRELMDSHQPEKADEKRIGKGIEKAIEMLAQRKGELDENLIKLASNAPAHWPDVHCRQSTPDADEGMNKLLFADALASALEKCEGMEIDAFMRSYLSMDGLLIAGIRVRDNDQLIPIFFYPESNQQSAAHYNGVKEFLSEKDSQPVYFSPEPLPETTLTETPFIPLAMRHLGKWEKELPQEDYAMWWPTESEPSFFDSAAMGYLDRIFASLDGIESYIISVILRETGYQETDGRVALPEYAQLPIEGPGETPMIISASREKGLRFHFPVSLVTPEYRDMFLHNLVIYCENMKEHILENKYPLDDYDDDSGYSSPLKHWLFLKSALQKYDSEGQVNLVGFISTKSKEI